MHLYIQFLLSLFCYIFLRGRDMCNNLFHWLRPCSENWSRRTCTRLLHSAIDICLAMFASWRACFQHNISVLSYLKHKTIVIHCYFCTMNIKIVAWDLCHLSDLYDMLHSIRNIYPYWNCQSNWHVLWIQQHEETKYIPGIIFLKETFPIWFEIIDP